MIKEDLFELIKSMSTAEKRLFKLKASTYNKHDKNSQLFDVYANLKDLRKLDKVVAKKLTTPRIHKLHSELYQQLQVFFAEEEIKSDRKLQLQQKIFTARNFVTRKLFKQASNIIEKVLQEALHFEWYLIAFEAISIKQKLTNYLSSQKGSEDVREKLTATFDFIINRIYETNRRFVIYNKLLNAYRLKGPARNKTEIKYYRSLTKNIDLEYGEDFSIQRNNILIKTNLSLLCQEQENSLNNKKTLLELYESYEHISSLNPRDCLIAYYNYAGELIEQNEMATAKIILDKMEVMISKHKNTKIFLLYHWGLSLTYAIRKQDSKQSLLFANKIAPLIWDDGDAIYKNYISVKITVAYLLSNEFHQALDFINLILNSPIKTQRKDCYSLLLMYEIVIFIKLGWQDMALSKLPSLIRYLKLHYNKNAFEDWCVGLLRKLISAEKKQYQKHIKNALQTIKAVRDNDLSVNILEVGEIEIWLQHEIITGN